MIRVWRTPQRAITCLVNGAATTMPSAWMATLMPIESSDKPRDCMRRLRRCIDRLVAKPTKAAAEMKATMLLFSLWTAAGAAVSGAAATICGFGRVGKRDRNCSHGGEEASSIRARFAVVMAAIAARLLFVPRQAMNYQKNVSALIKPLSK